VTVLDASAAVDLLLDAPPFATRIREHLLAAAAGMHAPHLLDAEVAQVLRRFVLAGVLRSDRAERAVERLGQLPITRYPHLALVQRALELRRNLTAYDAIYVALAEALGVPLLTRDAGIARSARRLIEVIHIG
jgi:predicted nucleic acid-binding protein